MSECLLDCLHIFAREGSGVKRKKKGIKYTEETLGNRVGGWGWGTRSYHCGPLQKVLLKFGAQYSNRFSCVAL